VQNSGVRYIRSAELRSALHTECRIQECATYGVHNSGVRYIQSAEFRSALHTECRVQECATYRVQNSGVRYIRSAEFRSVLHTECRIQECATYGVQNSGSAEFRSGLHTECRTQECATYRVQNSGVRYIRSAEFRSVLRTECRVQECAMYRVQSSGVCYIQIWHQHCGCLQVERREISECLFTDIPFLLANQKQHVKQGCQTQLHCGPHQHYSVRAGLSPSFSELAAQLSAYCQLLSLHSDSPVDDILLVSPAYLSRPVQMISAFALVTSLETLSCVPVKDLLG
ncbi:hypothetical protein AB205_0123360, partial [Aquarana catesbeiana]